MATTKTKKTITIEKPINDRCDPGWSEYILSKLTDDEKEDTYPRADGLRRLVEQEISPIVSIETNIIQAPQNGNNMTSTVRTTIRLANGEKYDAVTDVQKDDCISPYNQHISAIAETRAEGRAYRKILRLKNTVTKEEMVDGKPVSEDNISKNQIFLIDNLSSRLDINVEKLLNLLFQDKIKTNISSYSHDDGILIAQKLNELQSKSVPEDLKGYIPAWKD